MLPRPPIAIPAEQRKRLNAYREGFADELENILRELPRPCVYVRSVRTTKVPLRRSFLAKKLGAKTAQPVLAATASKFGGQPYAEKQEDWRDRRFLGQIDLAEAAANIPGLSLRGILRLDLPRDFDLLQGALVVTWFKEPSASRAVEQCDVESVGKWETRLEFRPGWSLPHNERDWFSLLPKEDDDDDLWDFWNDWQPEGFNEDVDDCHRMLGWPSEGLEEHYGFRAPTGCTDNVQDYEMLLRLTYDNQAGFAWGTNWVYVLVPREDFGYGDLSRAVVTVANV